MTAKAAMKQDNKGLNMSSLAVKRATVHAGLLHLYKFEDFPSTLIVTVGIYITHNLTCLIMFPQTIILFTSTAFLQHILPTTLNFNLTSQFIPTE